MGKQMYALVWVLVPRVPRKLRPREARAANEPSSEMSQWKCVTSAVEARELPAAPLPKQYFWY